MPTLTEDQKQKIFNRLKKVLKKYDKYFTPTLDSESGYTLTSIKEIEVAGRKRSDVAFASLLIQKNYVAFYYIPIYAFPEEITEIMPEELLKLRNGKSCFGFTKVNKDLLKLVDQILQRGRDLYEDKGWV